MTTVGTLYSSAARTTALDSIGGNSFDSTIPGLLQQAIVAVGNNGGGGGGGSAASMPTGAIMHRFVDGAIPGWVLAHGGTIGSATSGATERANADTQELYELLWDGVDQSFCPVAGGRGVNGAVDFSMGKAMTLPDLRGQVMVARLPSGAAFSAVVGSSLGAEEHTLIDAELPVNPSHEHTTLGVTAFSTSDGGPSLAADGNAANTGSAGGFGGGEPHNNIQPSRIVGAVYLKL
jgi:hypothetical protein